MTNVLLEIEGVCNGDMEGDLVEELDDSVTEAIAENMTHMEEKKVVEFSDAKKIETFAIWTRDSFLVLGSLVQDKMMGNNSTKGTFCQQVLLLYLLTLVVYLLLLAGKFSTIDRK